MEATLLIADDSAIGRDKGVVNMSFGAHLDWASDAIIALIWCKLPSTTDDNETNELLTLTGETGELMAKMEEKFGTIFVIAGNYHDRKIGYPDLCMPWLPGGLLVGAVDRKGLKSDQTPAGEAHTVFAPGVDLPPPDVGEDENYGSSFGKSESGLVVSSNMMLTFLSFL